MPKITNDDFYPVISSVNPDDLLIVLQGGIVKKVGAASVGTGGSVIENTGDLTINLTSLGGVLVVNNPAAVHVNLPSVGADEIGQSLEVFRIGAGSVTIHAADADTINNSAAGGTVASVKAGQTDAAIKIRLITETRYGIVSVIGSWSTT